MTNGDQLKIQIFIDSKWRHIGEVKLLEDPRLGLKARSEFIYDIDYAIEFSERNDWRAVSVATPVTTEPLYFDQWPPFLLDLFPQGASLRYVVDHYRIADREENYWKIIHTACLNPPGNLRVDIQKKNTKQTASRHPGFKKSDVVKKGPDFLEYMVRNGAPVAGTTGAGGAAPKFLLREDLGGMFHADGTLPDRETKACWLVKFRRGPTKIDSEILKAEKPYLDLAKELGLRTFSALTWEKGSLFIPRFDRVLQSGACKYYGLESFYSMVGHSEFGSRLRHETYLEGIYRYSTSPQEDLIEYCLRDFANQMMGNTDNHGRNQSLLKKDSVVSLAPLYDFAPMKFDPEGVVRNTRWDDHIEEGDLFSLANLLLDKYGVDKLTWDNALKSFLVKARRLERRMTELDIPESFVAGTKLERDLLIASLESYCGKIV